MRYSVFPLLSAVILFIGMSYPTASAAAAFGGTWACPGRGTLELNQNVATLSGGVSGKSDQGERWGSKDRNGGTVKGAVQGTAAKIHIEHGDGTWVVANATLTEDKKSFSGKWLWCDAKGIKGAWDCKGEKKGEGNWSCKK
jgi:hypothetical protein